MYLAVVHDVGVDDSTIAEKLIEKNNHPWSRLSHEKLAGKLK